MPKFAHLPLLLKPTGNGKLSKRDGDKMGFPVFPLEWKTAEGETSRGYREDGYFPESFVNLLALLGWNSGTEQEIFSMEELINLFSLERVNKSGARFDPEKAKWFNHQYLVKKGNAEIAEIFEKTLAQKGISTNQTNTEHIVGLVKERVNFVHEIWDQASFFFLAPDSYDEATIKKFWKEDTPAIIGEVVNLLKAIEPFTALSIDETLKPFINEKGYGMGRVMNTIRLALVGESKGPGVSEICEVIGKDETIQRLKLAAEKIR
jgi:glutamyl-tRNA synthetase